LLSQNSEQTFLTNIFALAVTSENRYFASMFVNLF